jgi:pSer/pThr/pTyr-binding forkhead associated (FHA) protein
MTTTLSATEVQLRVIGGDRAGTTIPVTGPEFVIGRDPDCQLRPVSSQVSRRHAQIDINEDVVTIRDLGSRNGTILNGKAVSRPTGLQDGDSVIVGPLRLVVAIATSAEAQIEEGTNAPKARASEEVVDEGSIFDDGSPGDSDDVAMGDTVSADDIKEVIDSFMSRREA